VPELPEVETVRAGLQREAVGRTIVRTELFGPRTVRRHVLGPADFIARTTNQQVAGACRRGKYLWLPLSSAPSALAAGSRPRSRVDDVQPDTCLVAHLGMSGQFLAAAPDQPDPAHLRARFTFADGAPELRFVDQRTFGGLALDHLVAGRDGREVPSSVAHIAPDPLEEAFDRAAFVAALRRKRTGVKRALLDQTLISGVGNIYADEALWIARLHYDRPADSLRRAEADRLLDAVLVVLTAAIRAGGTSFDALYVSVNGESGWFDRSLEVYGREGEPCSRCGAAIRREPFMNRSSFRCPRCQRAPRAAR
jgi:formamidopyrimidine-DNA glycosylase